jgi:predicted helicase
LRQIKSNWNEAYNTKFIRLNVCSEKDIDSDADNDIAITHTYEILGNVTTDRNLVASFLQKTDNKVVFSTYQSLQVIVDALQILPDFNFDLIIADEAHKTAGFSDQNKFTLVHNNEKVRGLKRLYMTATPRIASPELKAKHT